MLMQENLKQMQHTNPTYKVNKNWVEAEGSKCSLYIQTFCIRKFNWGID